MGAPDTAELAACIINRDDQAFKPRSLAEGALVVKIQLHRLSVEQNWIRFQLLVLTVEAV